MTLCDSFFTIKFFYIILFHKFNNHLLENKSVNIENLRVRCYSRIVSKNV